jgi:hypothetical protein
METHLANGRSDQKRVRRTRRLFSTVCLLAVLGFGCHSTPLIDLAPLDSAGMSYDAIQQAKALKITAPEVFELAKARQGGLPDAACVAVLQIYRGRRQTFDVGQSAAGLIQAGLHDSTIIELAKLNQLGLGAGELQAMRLAGIPDETILEIARRRAEGRTVPSGASLAGMKNAGLGDTTLLKLARRGVSDSQANAIIAARRHGSSDVEILRRFSGS